MVKKLLDAGACPPSANRASETMSKKRRVRRDHLGQKEKRRRLVSPADATTSANEICLANVATPSRRKLFDRAMSVFLVGNTHARQLFTEHEVRELEAAKDWSRPLRLLYLGVGDPRNPLASLNQLPTRQPVEFHLNDFSPVVLARAIVLLSLACAGEEREATSAGNAATAVWSDAKLRFETASALHVSVSTRNRNTSLVPPYGGSW